MSCSESIRACADGLGFSLVNECLKEVGMLSESILGNQEVQDLLLSTSIKVISEWPMLVAAIVMYTFDLCLIRPPDSFDPTTNFYYLLNKALQTRDAAVLRPCTAYLYYLVRYSCSLSSVSFGMGSLGLRGDTGTSAPLCAEAGVLKLCQAMWRLMGYCGAAWTPPGGRFWPRTTFKGSRCTGVGSAAPRRRVA